MTITGTGTRVAATCAALGATVLLAAGCSSTDSYTSPEPNTGATTTPAGGPLSFSPTPGSTTSPSDRCQPVDSGLLSYLSSKAAIGNTLTLTRGVAVKSRSFGSIYMVAATAGAGTSGVWAVTELSGQPTDVWAVDPGARSLTTWPDGASADPPITDSDDGVGLASSCLG